jgi:hypothetical protein
MAKRLPISKRALRALSRDQLLAVESFIQGLIHNSQDSEQRPPLRKDTVKEKVVDNKTYRLVLIRCGKERCRCATGIGHRSYWYVYWWEDGKTRSEYVGKKLPKEIKGKI